MRGGFVHNQVLVRRLDEAFRAVGAATFLEHPTGPSAPRGFVDLLAVHGPLRVVCEAELRASRVAAAIVKAEALQADCLLLVVPDQRTVRAVRVAVVRLDVPSSPRSGRVFVLTLGQALQWVRDSFPFLTPRNASGPETKKKPWSLA